ncbi:MAG: alpha/beta hydrolase [Burkholderiaceae bacterium]
MFIQRPDARLHTLSFGQGPITLLATGGWVGSGEVWHDLFGHLPDWRCISVDHRGTGASSHTGSITVEAMADDLIAVADAMRVGTCVLAAESAGAAAALLAVLRAPQLFAGLVLVGASWQQPVPGAKVAFIASLRHDYLATLRGFVDACLPETDSVELRRWGVQILSRASVDDAVELIACRASLPLEEQVRCIDLPVLLLHGDDDRIVPVQSSRDLAARLARAELLVMPGLGHVPLITEPARVAALIENFGTRAAGRQ